MKRLTRTNLHNLRDNFITTLNNISDAIDYIPSDGLIDGGEPYTSDELNGLNYVAERDKNYRNALWRNAETILSVLNDERLLTGIYIGNKKYPNGHKLTERYLD